MSGFKSWGFLKCLFTLCGSFTEFDDTKTFVYGKTKLILISLQLSWVKYSKHRVLGSPIMINENLISFGIFISEN